MQSSAKEVLETVARDLKENGYTHETAAVRLGYATRQAVSAVLSAGKYMTRAQARRFNEAFEYYEPYLVSGEGSLFGPTYDDGTTFYLPQHALLLRPFDNVEKFQEATDVFLESMIATYGAAEIQQFLKLVIRYIGFLNDPAEAWAASQTTTSGNDTFGARHMKMFPDAIKNQMEGIKGVVAHELYDAYSEMVKK